MSCNVVGRSPARGPFRSQVAMYRLIGLPIRISARTKCKSYLGRGLRCLVGRDFLRRAGLERILFVVA